MSTSDAKTVIFGLREELCKLFYRAQIVNSKPPNPVLHILRSILPQSSSCRLRALAWA